MNQIRLSAIPNQTQNTRREKKEKEEQRTMTSASTRWADIVQGGDMEMELKKSEMVHEKVVEDMVERFMSLVEKKLGQNNDDDLLQALETVSKPEFVEQIKEDTDRDFVVHLHNDINKAKNNNKSAKRIIDFYREELQKLITIPKQEPKKEEQEPKKEQQQEPKTSVEDDDDEDDTEYVTFKCKYVNGGKKCGTKFLMSHDHHKYLTERGCNGRFCDKCMRLLNEKRASFY